jgi:hypothetical protein
MRRFGIFSIAWLLISPVIAGQPVGMRNPQVIPANASAGMPASDDNLAAGGYPIAGGICAEWGHQVPCNNHYSTVRASTKYVNASDGIYASVPANVASLGSGNGMLPEEARTNDALWSRDMTNSAWVKTTMTTALNAIGIDGTANSATTLTATGAIAMAVQTITLASQADNYSVFLKRVTGSGTINLCLAATACGTATPCTVTSTIVFTRCTVTATVLNPIVGIQIVTNGDAVIADFNQMEPGGFATTPMLTTSSPSSRSADTVSLLGLPLRLVQSSSFFAVVQTGSQDLGASAGILEGTIDDVLRVAGNTSLKSLFGATTLTATLGSGSYTGGIVKNVIGASLAGRSLVANNGTLVTDAATISANTSIFVGSFGNGSGFVDAYFPRNTFGAGKPPDAVLQGFSR